MSLSKRKLQGFAVLTSVVLLTIAGIVFTASMVSTQLIDNQVIGNYYRNNEAFVNAESGINLILSKLDSPSIAEEMLTNLPYSYLPSTAHYSVQVTQVNANTLEIISSGLSMDDTAERKIHLQVNFSLDYPIPSAPLSSDGKLNLDASATVNDGCEGLSLDECLSPGNIADVMLLSNPGAESEYSELCSGDENNVGSNLFADNVFYGESEKRVIDNGGDWGKGAVPAGVDIFGTLTTSNDAPESLFEAAFAIEKNDTNMQIIKSYAADIDMTVEGAVSCSEQLKDISDEDKVIYIQGDCNIEQNDTQQSVTSENKRFTVGSSAHPKIVFMQGGTFITQPNSGVSIIGMLYFLPGKHAAVDENGDSLVDEYGNERLVEDISVDMGAVRVNGALLSDYKCSADGYDKSDHKGTKQHFSVRYDRTVLNLLYSQLGMPVVGSSYQQVEGSWRDF
ncbi:pilus assembly PilX N-terminal domain-containing protein [Psychromonas aquimarina]|uniref:pilus assembly PilX N-terminal domain-containing protein n=1 Tax=Psychromonas aquimarina TaxID=444919 RepID=UPI0003FDFEC8|nr:pilus assembly PilX N-terminal domain-containing protein [Psychromonas aquimarina]